MNSLPIDEQKQNVSNFVTLGLQAPVVTADREWAKLQISLEIQLIR